MTRSRAARASVRVVVGLVLLGLVGAAVVQVRSLRHHDALDRRRAAAVGAARDEVAALLTVNAATSEQDIAHLVAHATAGFRAQLQQRAAALRQAIAAGRVDSRGSVAAAGLVGLSGSTAVVAVAARAAVAGGPGVTTGTRSYRLTVSLADVRGRWLVSGLTFVV